MSNFESVLLSAGLVFFSHVYYWYRYADDVLCTWAGLQDLLSEFLAYLNRRYPSIKFTLEVGGLLMNFLDLSIFITDGVHEFGNVD